MLWGKYFLKKLYSSGQANVLCHWIMLIKVRWILVEENTTHLFCLWDAEGEEFNSLSLVSKDIKYGTSVLSIRLNLERKSSDVQ
jgi:hypothetical protein